MESNLIMFRLASFVLPSICSPRKISPVMTKDEKRETVLDYTLAIRVREELDKELAYYHLQSDTCKHNGGTEKELDEIYSEHKNRREAINKNYIDKALVLGKNF